MVLWNRHIQTYLKFVKCFQLWIRRLQEKFDKRFTDFCV